MLLLDDVFSELDGGRRQALTSFLQPYQTFITTTDADVVIQHFTKSAYNYSYCPSPVASLFMSQAFFVLLIRVRASLEGRYVPSHIVAN